MRTYLYELRKKVNMSQVEVQEYVLSKYRKHIDYSAIERGILWKDLSINNRATILAEVLNTTAEFILEEESKGNFYNGRNFRTGHSNEFAVKGRRKEYNEPLTDEEKALAIEYLPYAEKIISILSCNEYEWARRKIMTYADFYDLGIIAYLRCIKAISRKKRTQSEFMDNLENPDYFYRYMFSKAIKASYYHYARSELGAQRKDYHNAFSADATITDESDTELYNFIPEKGLTLIDKAVSSLMLDNLYSKLSAPQIKACKLLIAGWTMVEVKNAGIATEYDLGAIRFYLEQIKKYGKILWDIEEMSGVAPNLTYSVKINKWQVKCTNNYKFYSLGQYNAYTEIAFTYPLPEDEDPSELFAISNSETDCKHTGGAKLQEATKENPCGIKFNKKRNAYEPSIGSKRLGVYKNFEDAFAIRKEAEKHKKDGDFEKWYLSFKAKKDLEKIAYTRIDRINADTFSVARTFNRRTVYLGNYHNEKEAFSIKNLADSHIDKGDFEEWYLEFKKSKKPKPLYARLEKTKKAGRYSVVRNTKRGDKTFVLRLGAYEEDIALKVKMLADKHIDHGDFDAWYPEFYAAYKANKYEQFLSGIPAPKENNQQEAAYALVAFNANDLLCYKLQYFDNLSASHDICQTANAEEAYRIMDEANAHIEAGDFGVWLAEYKVKQEV